MRQKRRKMRSWLKFPEPESLKELSVSMVTIREAWELATRYEATAAGYNEFVAYTIPRSHKMVYVEDAEQFAAEAIAFYEHLKAHPEVQQSQIYQGIPICKICDKSSKEILKERVRRG